MEKIQCLICGKYFKRVCTHARQKHDISAREYKEEFGYDVKKGITTEEDRLHMRKLAIKNKMPEQLKKAGEKTRFKKGQPGIGIYKRSQETLKKLKCIYKFTKQYKKIRKAGDKNE